MWYICKACIVHLYTCYHFFSLFPLALVLSVLSISPHFDFSLALSGTYYLSLLSLLLRSCALFFGSYMVHICKACIGLLYNCSYHFFSLFPLTSVLSVLSISSHFSFNLALELSYLSDYMSKTQNIRGDKKVVNLAISCVTQQAGLGDQGWPASHL